MVSVESLARGDELRCRLKLSLVLRVVRAGDGSLHREVICPTKASGEDIATFAGVVLENDLNRRALLLATTPVNHKDEPQGGPTYNCWVIYNQFKTLRLYSKISYPARPANTPRRPTTYGQFSGFYPYRTKVDVRL
jgi:hypothetical protein